MKDTELDPLYVQNREQFKQLVASIIRPKIVQGKTLNGKEFIAFLKQVLLHIFVLLINYLSGIIVTYDVCQFVLAKLKLDTVFYTCTLP